MSEIKKYKVTTLAFKYEGNDSLPAGWWGNSGWILGVPGHTLLHSPCGQLVEATIGNWVICDLGWWKQVSKSKFEEHFQECES